MLDEIFEMFQDRSRKGRGSSSGGLMGKIGRLLEGDSADHPRSGYDRRDDDRDYRERGFSDREYREYRERDDDDRRDRRFDYRPPESGSDPRDRGVASDERPSPHPDERRFAARNRDDDRAYRRDDNDDDDRYDSRNRKRRAFDFDVDDD